MNEFVPPDKVLKEILTKARVIAVVGLSDNKNRASYRIGRFLKARGYKVIPVNPKYDTVFGLKSYSSLLDIPDEVDIVDIFRKPEYVDEIVEDAITIGAKVIWMQEGVINEKAAQAAKESGLEVVMDRCIFKQYSRLFLEG